MNNSNFETKYKKFLTKNSRNSVLYFLTTILPV
jgi:hypothetical protein